MVQPWRSLLRSFRGVHTTYLHRDDATDEAGQWLPAGQTTRVRDHIDHRAFVELPNQYNAFGARA